jgi:predicted ferric reductase
MVLITIWRHISLKKPAQIFLEIGIGLWAIATAIHWILFAFRNFVFGRSFATAVAKRRSNVGSNQSLVDPSNVLQVDIAVPRPWQVKAGQYIFLSIPKLGIFTGLRGHPFMISWWERDQKGLKISLLVKSRTGFTAELDRYTNKPLRAYIDGPYGMKYDFGEYGTVIMFATGIGIAAHLPYMKDLIRGYNSCEVMTRRIYLIWEIKEKCEYQTNLLNPKSTILTDVRSRAVGQTLDGRALGQRHRICTKTSGPIM